MNDSDKFQWLASVWMGYAVLGLYFMISSNAPLKRRLWTPYTIGAGVAFLGIVAATGAPFVIILIAAPFVTLITYFNLRRSLIFCDACGATTRSGNAFAKPRHCSSCGAPFHVPAA